ncbi:MAG: dihydrofolate reductase family protein, partial [Duncaniella sp.]|nr:dihydrofolate reductase family protein [Duncaniella sp.]
HIGGKRSYHIHQCGFDEFDAEGSAPIGHEAFHIASRHTSYSVSVDTRGTLLWDNGHDENHICIVSENASHAYLDYLRDLGISYIVSGKEGIDLGRAMEILHDQFEIRRVAVVGGGQINGGFLAAGLLDELSVMVAPGLDGRDGQPSLIDGIRDCHGFMPRRLNFKEVSTFSNGVVWIRYTF